jgi:hypothetical protein
MAFPDPQPGCACFLDKIGVQPTAKIYAAPGTCPGMAALTNVSVLCRRCGLTVRATVGDEVAVVQVARSDWSPKCWFRPEVSDPMGCAELLKALQKAAQRTAAEP